MHPESYTLRARRSYVLTEMEACIKNFLEGAYTDHRGNADQHGRPSCFVVFILEATAKQYTRFHVFLVEAFIVKITLMRGPACASVDIMCFLEVTIILSIMIKCALVCVATFSRYYL